MSTVIDRTRSTQRTVMVNLLPKKHSEARKVRRVNYLTGAGVFVVIVALGFVYTAKLGEIARAEEERDAVQAEVSMLRAEVAQLVQFRELANELEARNAMLASAMGSEVSFARLMNDLSLAFPNTASLRTLQFTMAGAETDEDVSLGTAVASGSYEGYSTERFAPGVEAVIVEFDKVTSFFHAYLNLAELELIDTTEVTNFQGSLQIDEDAFTRRYENGLPQEATQ